MIAAAFAAIALFVVSWTLLHVGFYKHKQMIDTPVYQHYGNAIADGKVPYRDFEVEYPPGALPVFALPGLAEPGRDQQVSTGFRRSFETLMWLCGAAALAAMAVILRTAAPERGERVGCPLLCGRRPTSAGLGHSQPLRSLAGGARCGGARGARVGTAAPRSRVARARRHREALSRRSSFRSASRSSWKRAGRREALNCLALALGVVAAVFAPFVILSPGGVWHSLSVQLSRPLQVESLGSALLLVGHHVFGLGVTGETSHGSQNLAGTPRTVLAVVLDGAAGGCADLDLGGVRARRGATRKRSFARPRPRSVRSSRSGRCCRRSS